jgi:hypothetical protein
VSLLAVADGPVGYEVRGRWSGLTYWLGTDRALASAVVDELASHEDIQQRERLAREATCDHENEAEVTAISDEFRRRMCMGCGRTQIEDW